MDGIELMAGAMHAAQARLDVSAANLANVSSAGFQRRVAHATLGVRGLSVSTTRAREQGPLEHTGRALDLAAVGGTFYVRDAGGAAVAERSVSFSIDRSGRFVDERGRVLLGRDGPARAGADGALDAANLRLSPGTTIESGFLERSNVDAIHEMVDVLSAQRAFETAQKTLSAIDETRAKDVNDVARVKA
jgi:flagellar basal body rod protein FlgG